MNRRDFGTGAGGLMAMGGRGMTGIARAARVKAVGLQLYTVRELFANDPVGTREKVVRIGYREDEFGGGNYEKVDPAMLRAAMDHLPLRAPDTHVAYELMAMDFAEPVTKLKTPGCDTITRKRHRRGQ